MALLEAKKLGISFGGLRAVDDFNISIEKGALYGLIGPNGAGKTTLMKVIYGLNKPESGEIYFEGKKVSVKSPKAAISLGIQMELSRISDCSRICL